MCNEADDVESQSDPTSNCAKCRTVGEFVERVAIVLPCLTEADVGQTDGTVDEEVCNSGKGEQPVEEHLATTTLGLVGKRQKTENKLQDNGRNGATLFVNVGEELWCHALNCERLNGTRGGVRGRVGDADNGDGDDGVEDGGEYLDAGVGDGEHKRRVLCACVARSEQSRVVVWNDESENEQVDNVEKGNAPEDLLGGFGDLPDRVRCLGGRKTGKLGTTVGKGRRDKDGAETLEACKGSGVVPVLCTNVPRASRDATAVDDDSKDDETSAGENFDRGEDELDLAISAHAEALNDGQDNEEDGDPDADVVCRPVLNGQAGGGDFKGKNGEPLNRVIPSDGKTPVGGMY